MTRGLDCIVAATAVVAVALGSLAAAGSAVATQWSLRRCPRRPLRSKSGAHLIAIVGLSGRAALAG